MRFMVIITQQDMRVDNKVVKLLIADDVAMLRDMLRAMIKKEGQFKIYEANNGDEALRIYKTNMPSIVFLDVNMPGCDGMSVLESIRAHDISTFVVMVSGNNTAENVIAAVNAGASGYVIKPFSQKNISAIIKKYYNSKK